MAGPRTYIFCLHTCVQYDVCGNLQPEYFLDRRRGATAESAELRRLVSGEEHRSQSCTAAARHGFFWTGCAKKWGPIVCEKIGHLAAALTQVASKKPHDWVRSAGADGKPRDLQLLGRARGPTAQLETRVGNNFKGKEILVLNTSPFL